MSKYIRTAAYLLLFAALLAGCVCCAAETASLELALTPAPTASPAPALTLPPTPVPTVTPMPVKTPSPTTLLDGRTDIFTYGITEQKLSYTSYTVSCTCYRVIDEENYSGRMRYYVADIYVKDVTSIRSAFSGSGYGHTAYESLRVLARNVNAVVSISGDYCTNRRLGLVIRDGVVYRTEPDPDRDVGVLYKDGTFKTYLAGEVPVEEILAADPWQSWCFGPSLLDENGKAKSSFNSDVTKANPRAVFGYYEPGHYCFVVVDGRQKKAAGMRMEELSRLMESLGCTAAINLDGGATAQMAWRDSLVNDPETKRHLSDFIYVLPGEEGVRPDVKLFIRACEPLYAAK